MSKIADQVQNLQRQIRLREKCGPPAGETFEVNGAMFREDTPHISNPGGLNSFRSWRSPTTLKSYTVLMDGKSYYN